MSVARKVKPPATAIGVSPREGLPNLIRLIEGVQRVITRRVGATSAEYLYADVRRSD